MNKIFDFSTIRRFISLRRFVQRKWQPSTINNPAQNPSNEDPNTTLNSPQEPTDIPAFPDLTQMKSLFKRPEFSVFDGLNEYDDDFTGYVDRSGILTHEMKRSISRSLVDQNKMPSDTIDSSEMLSDNSGSKQGGTRRTDPS